MFVRIFPCSDITFKINTFNAQAVVPGFSGLQSMKFLPVVWHLACCPSPFFLFWRNVNFFFLMLKHRNDCHVDSAYWRVSVDHILKWNISEHSKRSCSSYSLICFLEKGWLIHHSSRVWGYTLLLFILLLRAGDRCMLMTVVSPVSLARLETKWLRGMRPGTREGDLVVIFGEIIRNLWYGFFLKVINSLTQRVEEKGHMVN